MTTAALVAALALPALAATTASASPVSPAAPVAIGDVLDDWLEGRLASSGAGAELRVIVNAVDVATALDAVDDAGMVPLARLDRVGAVVAVGTPAQIRSLVDVPGIETLEGADRPLDHHMDTSHQATRADVARVGFATADGLPYDGAGTGIAVIDSGVDGNHPMFVRGGVSKVRRNLEALPLPLSGGGLPEGSELMVDDPDGDNNTDDTAGHGTHVAGTAAGYEVETPDGTIVRGAAPEATLYALSTATSGSTLYGAVSAQYWVLENAADPCGDGTCPAIVSVNNSYGPVGGGSYNPNSTTAQIQQASIAQDGVTWVWSAGNNDGDGSADTTGANPNDPTPGVIGVASYDDGNTGDRDGVTSGFSSRGAIADPSTWPDLAAPGSNILSACRLQHSDCATSLALEGTDQDFGNLSGTSMASPHIAGYVAVLKQADPSMTPAEVEFVLEDTAHRYVTDAFGPGESYRTATTSGRESLSSFENGHGLVDVAAALAAVLDTDVPDVVGPCATYVEVTDPEGDAAVLTGLGPEVGGGLPTPDVDITGVYAALLTTEAGPVVRFTIRVADLPEAPVSAGDAVRSFFGAGGTAYTLDMSRELDGTTSAALSVPDPADPAGVGSIVVARPAVVFDAATDLAWADLPVELLGDAGVGDALSGVRTLWRRSGEAVALPADEAAATCPLLITDGPPVPVVPEGSPALLLVGAGIVLGGLVLLRRRRDAA